MSDERRDDTGLISLICPHCKQTAKVIQIDVLKHQQLVYMKCPECEQGITKEQIDATYREYRQSLDRTF